MANYQKFSFKRFIKRAVLITLLLALVEVFIIFFFMAGKNESSFDFLTKTKKEPQSDNIDRLREADQVVKKTATYTVAPKDSLVRNDTALINPPNKEKAKTEIPVEAVIPTNQTPIISPTDSLPSKPVNAVQTKLLTRANMISIVNRIKAEKRRTNNTYNCVQVKKTATSNVTNAFKIAEYLKSKGFTIAGRMIVSGHQDGINVNAGNGCISVTIGSL